MEKVETDLLAGPTILATIWMQWITLPGFFNSCLLQLLRQLCQEQLQKDVNFLLTSSIALSLQVISIVSICSSQKLHFKEPCTKVDNNFDEIISILGWVYPVVTHWGWSDDGWMKNVNCRTINSTSEEGLKISEVVCISYADFAGSGIVHVFGAVCALIGCYFIGPREGRYTSEGISVNIPGHSVPLSALGGFILLFGFLAFNGGSQVR